MPAPKPQAFAPFPDDIDRDHFGSWLSGFADGEGCFILKLNCTKTAPLCAFQVYLRDDDVGVIRLIQSFWKAGSIFPVKRYRNYGNEKPQIAYLVSTRSELPILLDHFTRFPMMAKKRRDFAIWAHAVRFYLEGSGRSRTSKRRRDGTACNASKWTEAEIDWFRSSIDQLREIRRYASPTGIPNPLAMPSGRDETQGSLF